MIPEIITLNSLLSFSVIIYKLKQLQGVFTTLILATPVDRSGMTTKIFDLLQVLICFGSQLKRHNIWFILFFFFKLPLFVSNFSCKGSKTNMSTAKQQMF